MLKETFPEASEDVQNSIFMQDGAPAHTSRLTLVWQETTFRDRLISNKSDFMWPPCSPDLNPCEFFLRGYMKEVHRAQPGSTAEVKQLIQELLASIDEERLQRVTIQFSFRVKRCIATSGEFFE